MYKRQLLEAIENSLLTACKNHFGKADNVKVNINPQTGDFSVYAEKEVVEEVEDPVMQISLAEAKMKSPKYNLGDVVHFPIAVSYTHLADEHGNITMEEEGAPVDALDVAMAVKAMGGKVIVQVKNYVSGASIDRSSVVIPGNLVDAVVVSENPLENHRQTPGSVSYTHLDVYKRQIMCIFMMIATSWSARHLGYQPDHKKPSSFHERCV